MNTVVEKAVAQKVLVVNGLTMPVGLTPKEPRAIRELHLSVNDFHNVREFPVRSSMRPVVVSGDHPEAPAPVRLVRAFKK